MKKYLCAVWIAFMFLAGCADEKDTEVSLNYDVRFPNAAHNEAEITLTIRNLNPGPVQFTMSRASPGRYALHEFTKNIYNVKAKNSRGNTLTIEQPDLHNWIVNKHDGIIKLSYTLYGDRADGTYTGINRRHAHLNMPATFIWARDFKKQPITVQFHPPQESSWKAATQLKPTDDPFKFNAPDFQYFMDSPTELSNFRLKAWTIATDTTEYTIRLALHHNGTESELDNYAERAQKVVAEQIAVYGEPPVFDYGTYTFIADYLPYVYGDGMEHRNSTILTSTRSLEEGAMQNLGTLSHEFFHAWSVERIRPNSLEPFDFTEANMSGALWFAEGFTSYYDDLMIRRAGLTGNKAYAEGWEGTLNSVLNVPGSRYYSPVEMSCQAPFVDAASSIDPQNKANTFVSYYSWGAVLGLGLDLTLRSKFDDITLDDYMRAMWDNHGKPEEPYTLGDLQSTLAEVTGNTTFAENFFNQYIYGNNMINLKPLLAKAGFDLEKEYAGRAVIEFGNAAIDFEQERPTITGNTTKGSPLYMAGLDRDDKIISLDGQSLTNARKMQRILAGHAPGDSLSITYESLSDRFTEMMVLTENPALRLIPFEQTDRELTDAMRMFRESWLGSRAK